MVRKSFWIMLVVLLGVVGFLFRGIWDADQILRYNDSTLGILSSEATALPSGFWGYWLDLNWVGLEGPSAVPSLSFLWDALVGPLNFTKTYAPMSVIMLGLAAWYAFRRLGMSGPVAALAALATALNMNTFSNVCWGLGSRAITMGFTLMAIGAVTVAFRVKGVWSWIYLVLAGLFLGMGVMDGYDMGAIYSLYVAAYVLWLSWVHLKGEIPPKRVLAGLLRVGVVALMAGVIAYSALTALIGTQVQGVAGMEQDSRSKQERWDWATQWSLPKSEILRVVVPGLHGYLMDSPDGKVYWGAVGQTPGNERTRFSGAGEYLGVFVLLVALWAGVQGLRRKSGYTEGERYLIGFWAGAAGISVLLAFGRHAPFYQLVYPLPFFSTIRNPIKFMHLFHLCMLILFAYGLEGIRRMYLEEAKDKGKTFVAHFKVWWKEHKGEERRWTFGMLGALAVAGLGWILYVGSKSELSRYLKRILPEGSGDEEIKAVISSSFGEAGLAWVFLALAVFLFFALRSGWFSGKRAVWAYALIGLFLVVDLGRANANWVVYLTYKAKYASNPIIDTLREGRAEHRVSAPGYQGPPQLTPLQSHQMSILQSVYRVEWMQHPFQYYNVQSLDVIQMPRIPEAYKAYHGVLGAAPLRLWQLTNTRYLLGLSSFAEAWNTYLDPGKKRFKIDKLFTFGQKEDGSIYVEENETGPFALIEFEGALPRAKLYSHWVTQTNDTIVLQQLANPTLNLEQNVFVSSEVGLPSGGSEGEVGGGLVETLEYAPKRVLLKVNAAQRSVLLYNGKYDPSWRVWVDGEEKEVLRCNYLMRGVQVEAGEHEVEFRFRPPSGGLYVSLLGIFGAIGLGAVTGLRDWRKGEEK